jgi:hypothetical protein
MYAITICALNINTACAERKHQYILYCQYQHNMCFQYIWQGRKDSNLRMLESKSSALTNLATPLHWLLIETFQSQSTTVNSINSSSSICPAFQRMFRQIAAKFDNRVFRRIFKLNKPTNFIFADMRKNCAARACHSGLQP